MRAIAARERHNAIVFSALAFPHYRTMWLGLVVVNLGQMMQMFGLGWLVVQLAERDGTPQLAPLWLGLLGLFRVVPGLSLGLFAGVITDRVDRRRLLLTTQSVGGLVALVLAVLTLSDHIGMPAILVLNAVAAGMSVFDTVARSAVVPRLVPERHLVSAVGLLASTYQLPTLFGPLLGGLLIGPLGIGGLFLLDAISYIAVLGALLRMPPQPMSAAALSHPLRAIAEGVMFARRDAVVRGALIMSLVGAFGIRSFPLLLPAFVYASLGLGAVELSWLLAASGLGGLLGTFATGAFGGWNRRGLLQCAGGLAAGVLLFAFSLERSLPLSLGFITCVALGAALAGNLPNLIIQLHTPVELRGRVISLNHLTYTGFSPLGQAVLGGLGTFVGIDRAIGLGGLLVALVAVGLLVGLPAVRRPDVIAKDAVLSRASP